MTDNFMHVWVGVNSSKGQLLLPNVRGGDAEHMDDCARVERRARARGDVMRAVWRDCSETNDSDGHGMAG